MFITIRPFLEADISMIVSAFAAHQWRKPHSVFVDYLDEQKREERQVWLAYAPLFAGYVTLKWQSDYAPFRQEKIPEIKDLNVLPPFRTRGIGSKLLDTAEQKAWERTNKVGLGVGLYQDYGPAQRLYVKRGYVPNGLAVTYNYHPILPGSNVLLDDDLLLWLIKQQEPQFCR